MPEVTWNAWWLTCSHEQLVRSGMPAPCIKVRDVIDPGLEDDPDPLLHRVVGPDLLCAVLWQSLLPSAGLTEDAGLSLGQESSLGPPLVIQPQPRGQPHSSDHCQAPELSGSALVSSSPTLLVMSPPVSMLQRWPRDQQEVGGVGDRTQMFELGGQCPHFNSLESADLECWLASVPQAEFHRTRSSLQVLNRPGGLWRVKIYTQERKIDSMIPFSKPDGFVVSHLKYDD